MGKKKKTKPLGILYADPYGSQIAVVHGVKHYNRYLKWLGVGKKTRRDALSLCEGSNGNAALITDPSGLNWYFLVLIDDIGHRLIYHECLHLAWFVLEAKGVAVDSDNQEALTYLQGYLAEQALDIVNRKLKG